MELGLYSQVMYGFDGSSRSYVSMALGDADVGLINQYGLEKNGGQLINMINSISPKFWDTFGIAPP